MLPVLGLFHSLPCPRQPCPDPNCLFSHNSPHDLPPPPPLDLPPSIPLHTAPLKRHTAHSPSPSTPAPPPRKLQRVGPPSRPHAVPTAPLTSASRPLASAVPPRPLFIQDGVPVLRINAAQSRVALPVRQTMLKTLYDHFTTLYASISHLSPSLAADHALKQEEEVYKKSTKLTYRNAVIQSVAALKRRTPPTALSHPSVGTEDDIKSRLEHANSLKSLVLSPSHLQPLVLSTEAMQKWGFMLDIPDGPGGEQPTMEGKLMRCERCTQPFQVSRTGPDTECLYHWGKLQTTKAGGEKVRVYTCCSRPAAESEGCVHGRHVFYESSPQDLHSRHPFSFLRPPSPSTKALDIAAMDCEMIYTTGGFRVARVSIIDARGKEVFDELVRMDDDVYVIDYITRFSGMTEEIHSKATLNLSSIRKSLDTFINSDTILVGHALDNDLRTMRIVHHKCVDTAILFPHKAGPPYRRALRDLVREKLGRMIQTGDASTGHSSAEDASASLDLVRWYILDKQNPKASTSNA